MGVVPSCQQLPGCDNYCRGADRVQNIVPNAPEFEHAAEHAEIIFSKIQGPSLPEAVVWQPLSITLIGCKNLRNADISFPFRSNLSDPYCICNIQGKPLSTTVTQVIQDNLNPQWNHEAQFNDFQVGDTLLFTIWDKDSIKRDDFLGRAQITSDEFHPGGFHGDLLLAEAGKNRKAFLKVRIEPAVQVKVETPKAEEASDSPKRSVTGNTVNKYSQLKASGNVNRPSDYVWLEDCIRRLASNEAGAMKCRGEKKGSDLTPVLFVAGGCPNAMCGMQAVMFAVDSKQTVDFWWVKPLKDDPTKIEPATLNYNESGKHKNNPGRSGPFYQPLADLFQQGVRVRDWCFGLKTVSHAGKDVVRAFINHVEEPDERLYILFLWQEDFPLNPFARSKYIKGKIVYQRTFDEAEYFQRQYELQDGICHIADFEEGPVTTVLPGDDIKTLWDIGPS